MEVLKPQPRSPSEIGMSLPETLVALLILSFVAVSTLAMLGQGMRLNAAGVDYNSVCSAAKDTSEELLKLGYDHPNLVPGPVFRETLSAPPLSISWRVAEHEINAVDSDPSAVLGDDPMVSTVAEPNSGNLKVIAVTVSSNAAFGVGLRSMTVQVLKCRS